MPEGPEIKRLSDAIREIVEGERAVSVEIGNKVLQRYESELAGKRVARVEPRGKATLFVFENELNVFTHLQLYGRWFFAGPGERPDVTRQLKFAVTTEKGGVFLYSSPDVEVMHAEDLDNHAYLSKLGPDVLDEEQTDVDLIERRLQESKWAKMPLGKLLLDQAFAAGIGNYLRSEILFAAGLRPEAKAMELDAATRRLLAEQIITLPRRSYHQKGATTSPQFVQEAQARGEDRDQYRFFVYKRAGEPCRTCHTSIVEGEHGGRRYFSCARCQPER